MQRFLYIILSVSLLFSACEKSDTAVVLPSPGELQHQIVNLGADYEYQAYVSLSNNSIVTRDYIHAYDIAFEASANGMRVYLNEARMMTACNTGSSNFTVADTTGKKWRYDQEKLNPDSTAIGNWWINSSAGSSLVYCIDRGSQLAPGDRFRKFKIIAVNDTAYQVSFSNSDNSHLTVMSIPKDTSYALIYLSFDNGGKIVQMAPPKDQWDFVFTRYVHEYFEYPELSPYRHYEVTGAVLNVWNNIQGSKNKVDSTANYVMFDSCTYKNVLNYNFTNDADIVGYDWKYYVINDNHYYITQGLYYVVEDKNGFYYKLRILDFYDQQGNKGTVTFQYQRM